MKCVLHEPSINSWRSVGFCKRCILLSAYRRHLLAHAQLYLGWTARGREYGSKAMCISGGEAFLDCFERCFVSLRYYYFPCVISTT